MVADVKCSFKLAIGGIRSSIYVLKGTKSFAKNIDKDLLSKNKSGPIVLAVSGL